MVFLSFGGNGTGKSPRAHVHNASVSITSRPSTSKGVVLSTTASEQNTPASAVLVGLTPQEKSALLRMEALYRERWRDTLRAQMHLMNPLPLTDWWTDDGALPEDPGDGRGEKALNDEEWLLLRRFLAARQFDVNAAAAMLDTHIQWRSKWDVDQDLCNRGALPKLEILRQHYPSGYYGVSKKGAPVYYDRAGRIKIKELQQNMTEEDLIPVWIQMYEHSQQVILPACSIAAGRRVTQGVTIMDLEGLGWAQISGESRAVLKKLISINQDNYPESMEALFIVKAPMIVSGILKFVKALLDKKTAAKIKVLSERGAALRKRLSEYIDPDQLPEFLFGPDDGTWMRRPKGPWVEESVLQRLQAAFPTMAPAFVGLAVEAGSPNNLSAKSPDSPELLKVCSYMEDCQSLPSEVDEANPAPPTPRRRWWHQLLRRLTPNN